MIFDLFSFGVDGFCASVSEGDIFAHVIGLGNETPKETFRRAFRQFRINKQVAILGY